MDDNILNQLSDEEESCSEFEDHVENADSSDILISCIPTMLFSILVYLFYYAVYTILLAIAGLWCFEECLLTEDEEYEFTHQYRAMPY
ncbi:hypothetical protein SFRURICE_013706 [Spodoptera frugiperda]|nr:hypothetical protein SFRURICE_013706 [Spodoptera frugiperda]